MVHNALKIFNIEPVAQMAEREVSSKGQIEVMCLQLVLEIRRRLTFTADSLSILKRCKINCVLEPFTISVRNTIPPVKNTNYKSRNFEFNTLTNINMNSALL